VLRAHALTALLILGLPASVLAHDPGLSALDVRVARTHLVVDLSLAAEDAAQAARRGATGRLDVFAQGAIELLANGRPLPITVEGISTDEGGVRIRLVAERPDEGRVVVRSGVPRLLPRGHRQLLTVRSSGDTILEERMLDAEAAEAAVDLDAMAPASGRAAAFFQLGVEHILGGYDHLLFLAALLVVIRRATDVIKTVTAFTLAHSLTLALATLGSIELPPPIVEPLIAASIVYVGLENLLRRDVGSRAAQTFVFGLIHGFGFAGALREIGLGAGGAGLAVPLASFNLGVEAGQMAVALAILPVLWRLRAHPAIGARMTTAGSVLVLLAGGYWLVERSVAAALAL
jgi:hydrogenase/urease accessory protein HupE